MDIKVMASGSSGNCYLVSDKDGSLLLEAGIPIGKIRMGCDFHLHDVDGCLVTHSHSDHSKAVKDILKAGVSVYMPKLEIAALKLPDHFRLHGLELARDGRYKCITVGSFLVQPFRVEHDTPEPVGYLIRSRSGEKLLYFTDTYYLHYRFSGLNYIIGECNYDRDTMWNAYESGSTNTSRAKRLFTSHMSLDNFLGFLAATDLSQVKRIYVCHMSGDHGHEKKTLDAVRALTDAEVIIC